MDNSTKIIDSIRDKNLKPLPRWRFTLKNAITWLAFILCVLFGALAFSVVLFAIQQVDFNLVRHLSHSWFEMLLGLVPLFWIISLIVFLVMAILSIRNSKKGYKFTPISLVGFATALSILAGTLFFISGGAQWLEHAFATNVSAYESIQERKTTLWTMPEEGYLSGTILSRDEGTFEMEDFTGKKWTIDYQDADVVPAVRLVVGERIKMSGKMTSGDNFSAQMIRPWGGFQRMGRGNGN